MGASPRASVLNTALLAAGLAVVLVGCGGGRETAATSTVTATSKVTVTETSVQNSTPTSAITPAEAPPADLAPLETTHATSAQIESWIMPNEIGKNLQRAQDDLQALTGDPLFISTSEDLTGQGRQQIMDRNWQVCSSTPPPGSPFTSQTNVVFGVVRDSESCR